MKLPKITSKQLQDLASERSVYVSMEKNRNFWQDLSNKVNEFFGTPGDFETEEQTSFEYRKNEVLTAITNRESLPLYANYGDAKGGVYIRYFTQADGWVYKDIDFYEIIEAVAKRAPRG